MHRHSQADIRIVCFARCLPITVYLVAHRSAPKEHYCIAAIAASQEGLVPLLIQVSPQPLLITFRNGSKSPTQRLFFCEIEAGDLLDTLKNIPAIPAQIGRRNIFWLLYHKFLKLNLKL